MERREKLKSMIAESLNISSNEINDDFSLTVKKYKTSAGSVILNNMIRKVYGKKINCKGITTFGELVTIAESNQENVIKTEEMEQSMEVDSKIQFDVSTHDLKNTPELFKLNCGVDIQEVSIFPNVEDYWLEPFYVDHFTDYEIAYCSVSDSPIHSFTGRWCIKEALHKCGEKYFNIPMKNIQVVKTEIGILAIEVLVQNEWSRLPLSCSISHSGNYAVGMVMEIK